MSRGVVLAGASLIFAIAVYPGTVTTRGAQQDADKAVSGGGGLPAGWQARLDSAGASLSALKFMTMGTGLHATTGPAAIFYKPGDVAKGTYSVRATFTQMKPSAHPEAYGVFFGGSDLQGPGERYSYFVIRQDGEFLIKRRAGSDLKDVMDWTPNAAVKKADETGKMTNALAVEVGADKVRFLSNDTEVASLPSGQVDVSGIAGLRINHNLDVHVEGFAVK